MYLYYYLLFKVFNVYSFIIIISYYNIIFDYVKHNQLSKLLAQLLIDYALFKFRFSFIKLYLFL